MTNRQWANEQEMHQDFIDSVDIFPEELKGCPGDKVVVWASELRIHDAGRFGGDGSADLITVDESGMTWIIEVKVWDSAELNREVWQQLLRYRDGLMAMSWNDIHGYCDRFLMGEGTIKPAASLSSDSRNLVDAFRAWKASTDSEKMDPECIRDAIANSLKNGTAGLAVLSDGALDDVIRGGEGIQHNGPLACIEAFPGQAGMCMAARWWKRGGDPAGQHCRLPVVHQEDFEKYRVNVQQRCTPQTLPITLCHEAAALWNDVIQPGFGVLGWNGQDSKRYPKCVVIAFPVGNKCWPMIQAGWSVTDSKRIKREHKNIGTAGLRLDIDLKFADQVLGPDRGKVFVEKWGMRFYELGWRGRMYGKDIGIRPLTDDAYRTWTKILCYKPSDTVEDFLGRPEDAEVIGKLLAALAEMIGELGGSIPVQRRETPVAKPVASPPAISKSPRDGNMPNVHRTSLLKLLQARVPLPCVENLKALLGSSIGEYKVLLSEGYPDELVSATAALTRFINTHHIDKDEYIAISKEIGGPAILGFQASFFGLKWSGGKKAPIETLPENSVYRYTRH
ncbi:MAG: hypothetical protein EOM12_03945 [Verrucomicrobiae bacterium]|nr:hypothetical protein [Verrucomicrobiae bacterium]